MKISPLERAILVIDSFGKSAEKRGLLQGIAAEVKIFLTFFLTVTVLSFSKYEGAALLPYFIMLAFLTAASEISFKKIFLRIGAVSPFVLFIGILNPFFDHTKVIFLGLETTGGWASFFSIILKFILTAWCALLLVSSTRFQAIVKGLRTFRIPQILANQFYFLFRYIRLLLKEALTLKRAREARLYGENKFGVKIFANLAGALAVRSIKRADVIHNAMLARGFAGNIPNVAPVGGPGIADAIFLIVSLFCCIFFRFVFIF